MPSTRLVALAAAAVLSVAVLAGCGSSSESASDTTVTSPGDSVPMESMSSMGSTPAASSSTGSSTGAPGASGATITISNFDFGPAVTVKPGATITVINKDTTPHDVDADDGTSFNTPLVSNGSLTFTAPMTPGTYPFHCSIHANMHGTLTVAP